MSTKERIKYVSEALGLVVGILALIIFLPLEGAVPIREHLEWVPEENSLVAIEGYAIGEPKASTTLAAVRSLAEDGYPTYLLAETGGGLVDESVVVRWIVRLPSGEVLLHNETFDAEPGLVARDPHIENGTLYAPTSVNAIAVFWNAVVPAAIVWAVAYALLYWVTYGAVSLVSALRGLIVKWRSKPQAQ